MFPIRRLLLAARGILPLLVCVLAFLMFLPQTADAAVSLSPAFGISARGVVSGLLAGGTLLLLGYGLVSNNVNDDFLRNLIKQGLLDAAGGIKRNVVAKTADYTILANTAATGDPSGTIFTTRGAAGAVIFTLPAVTKAMAGTWYEFVGLADQCFTIATATADTLTVVNDAAADSLAVSTASHKIGAVMRVYCDGTAWIAIGISVGDTFTVAT